MNIALIGHGYWGKNILRNLIENKQTGKITVCDQDQEKLNAISYPGFLIEKTTDTAAIIEHPQLDAVIIATPASTHFSLAKQALENGKHVLVEKPFCTNTAQAEELCRIAEAKGKVLMVDHIYLFNPVVRQLKEFIGEQANGKISYIDSTRINLGIYQKDTNVLWDLACHDVSIINHLLHEKPQTVRALGRTNPVHHIDDIVYLYLYYPSGVFAHINASWASPVKLRKMIIGGEKRMIIYDDIEPTNKLTIYDYDQKSLPGNKSFLIDYRLGNITIPKCAIEEPLQNVIREFYQAIKTGSDSLSDGRQAVETIRILEAAQKSLDLGGEIISLQ